MRALLKNVKKSIINLYFWWLDYIYVGFWQLCGLLRRGNARGYLSPGQSNGNPPVILIPGVYERWEFMRPVAQAIFQAGYAVHVIEGLGYNRGSVEAMAKLVKIYIANEHLNGCIIVAHSKGGLIGKYLLMGNETSQLLKGMVAINTPFGGSKYASVLPVRGLRMFIPNSPVLQKLAQNNRTNRIIVSIYSLFDPHIPGGSYLKGATNVQLNLRGHFRIMQSKALHAEILAALGFLKEVL